MQRKISKQKVDSILTNSTPIISVVIPTYNRRNLLSQCLASIYRQTYKKFEIIIIDDASSDRTIKFIKKLFQKIKIISNTRRLGPSYCRNQGLLSSKGNIILFLDSDTEFLDNNVFRKISKLLWESKKIGSVGGEIFSNLPNIAYGRSIQKNGMSIKVGCSGEERLKECDYLPTSNCAVRKEVVLKVGGFDPYYIYGAEDKEFGSLIKQRGYQNYISYEVATLHKLSREARTKIGPHYHWSRTTLRFLIKNRALRKIFLLIGTDLKFTIERHESIKDKVLASSQLMRGYLWNVIHLNQTLKAKGKNFLTLEEMRRFKKSKILKIL